MAKSKADSNREFKEKLANSGGKRLTVVLSKEEAEKLENFMKLHKISSYREFINFCTEYKLSQFNSVQKIDMKDKTHHDTFIRNGQKYALLMGVVYATMCSDIDTGEIFPLP